MRFPQCHGREKIEKIPGWTESAAGTYIALLDSSDVWVPDKLERQLARIKRNGVGIAYSAYDPIDENGRSVLDRVDIMAAERTAVFSKHGCALSSISICAPF